MTTGTVQKKSKNRPCDRCRLKKRKCDGNLPCATCLRCRTGDAVCTYNNEKYSNLIRISKNDDASIFKLQYLENVLNSIVPNTNASIFTVPQQTFQFTSFGPVQPLEIEFHQFQSNMSMNGFTDMQIDPNHLQHQYQTSLDPFFSNLEPPTFPTQVEDSLENHLIGLSYLYYAGYTVNKNLRPVELCQRDTPLSYYLKKAICFQSVFLSTHPDLFPNAQPSFREKLEVAQNYMFDPTQAPFINQINPADNQQVCDDIRAILILCMTQFSLGNPVHAMDLLHKAAQFLKHFGILNKRALEDNTNAAMTLDDLVSVDIAVHPLTILTEQEKCERLSLLAMLLGIDTFGSIASGSGFIIDEGEFPECGFPGNTTNLFSKDKQVRKMIPDLAKHTLWQGTNLAPLTDDIREVSNNIFKGDANATVEAQFELLLLRLIRRIIRYSRDQKFAKNTGQDRFAQMILHNSMLQYLAYSPSEVCSFNSFQPFLFGSDAKLNHFEKNHSDTLVCNSLVFLSAFSYLHFGTAMNSDDTKFSLDMGGQCAFTSRDIMFALIRILAMIFKECGLPMHPADSAFGTYPYPPEELKKCMETPTNLASPLLCMPLYTLLGFVTVSGAVAVFQRENSPQAQQVYHMAHDIILPVFEKVDVLWPNSENYSSKLKHMLNNFI